MNPEEIKILVIEDEPGLQMTLEDRLKDEGYKVTIKGDGLRGEKQALENPPDLILLDLMLPGRDGFQICQNLRERGLQIPILMLTARNSSLDTVTGLRLGADDYLAKPFDMQILLARISALLRRSQQQREGKQEEISYRFGDFFLDREKKELFRGDELIPLNGQEYRLLLFLVEHPQRILERNELLDGVWGYGTETTTRTVDVHIGWLRQKLGEKDRPFHILTLRGQGYKFVPVPG